MAIFKKFHGSQKLDLTKFLMQWSDYALQSICLRKVFLKKFGKIFKITSRPKVFSGKSSFFWKFWTFFLLFLHNRPYISDFIVVFHFFRLCCDDPDEKNLLENLSFMSKNHLKNDQNFEKSIFSDIFLL